MRAREIITEKQKVDVAQVHAIPSMSSVGVPGMPMGPSNFYHKYRLGVDMAGQPDPRHDYPTEGEFVDDMVMVGYSPADRDIIAKSVKKFGYKPKKLSSDGSNETRDTNTVSPVSNWMDKK